MAVFSFVGGKGGVGKTTCAAIAALRLASLSKTLLVTTDPASSLADALGMDVAGEPRPAPRAPGLFAANVDAARAFERWLAPRRPLVAQIAVRGTYLDEEDVGRLLTLSLPGIDEVIGLVEVVRLSQGFDRVVVDTAPTGHTLRLLAAPAMLGRVAGLLDGLQAHHRAVVSALRGSYRADGADALIADLRGEGEALAAMLRDVETAITWVTLPEPMALEETADAIAALDAAGIAVRTLLVNRITPHGECDWCDARRRFESRALRFVPRRFPGLAIETLPESDREPRGAAALKALGQRQKRWSPRAAARPIDHRVRASLDLRPEGRSYPTSSNDWTGPIDRRDRSAAPGFSPEFALAGNLRWLLFGGKGGVGKSTCAAAVALKCAESKRVLLLSVDPAHSLGDVFGQRFDNTPRSVDGADTLHVREIDAAAEMDRLRRTYLKAVDETFARLTRAGAGDQEAFRELLDLAPPGIDEVIAIADVAAALAGGNGQYDLVVTDTAPTGHALRLLHTPALLREWTQTLMALLLKYREVVGAGSLAALLIQLSKRLRGLEEVLTDPERTGFVVVTRPAALPSGESRALARALEEMGMPVTAIVVNAAGRGRCRRCRAIARRQAAEVDRLGAVLGTYAIIEAPAEVPPPHGRAVLAAWIGSWRHAKRLRTMTTT